MIYLIGIPLRHLPNRNISIIYPRNLDLDPDSDNPILLDSMFGKLAQWLRMIGLNIIFLPNFDDKLLIEHDYTVITRDVDLFIRRLKRHRKTVLLYSDNFNNQLILVLSLLRKLPSEIPKPKYCTVCGGRLIKVETSRLSAGEIPIHVIHRFRYVWKCCSCGKIYWKGSHHPKIRDRFLKALENVYRIDRVLISIENVICLLRVL